MARTPLFSLIKRSLALAAASERSGRTPDELRDLAERSPYAIHRRAFLQSTAVAAAGVAVGVALPACAPVSGRGGSPATGASSLRRGEAVVVVGAGIAGLTCAWRLRQAGIPVRLIEAQSRTGGRMYSLRNHFADGQVCELGGELIDTGHTTIRELADELGIALNDLSLEEPQLSETVWHIGGANRSEEEVVNAFLPLAARIRATLAPFGGEFDPTAASPQNAGALDRTTLAAWLDTEGVTGWFRTLLNVAYTTEYGLEPHRQSALNFLTMIDPEAPPFHIFGESDERFHTQGGNDRIVSALAERVTDAVETSSVLEAVARRADGRHTLTFRRDSGTRTVIAQHVVLALPFTLLRQVTMDVPMPSAKRRAINELGYGTNAKLMVGFSSRPWRERHASNGSVVTDLPFQLLWETSRKQPGSAGILTNFSGGDHGIAVGQGTAAEQASRLVSDLERIFPGVTEARAGMTEARFHWPTNRWVQGSYSSYLAGQWTSVRGVEAEPVDTLYFAGEHCSLDAQGYMEGGCETGTAAAAMIRERLLA